MPDIELIVTLGFGAICFIAVVFGSRILSEVAGLREDLHVYEVQTGERLTRVETQVEIMKH